MVKVEYRVLYLAVLAVLVLSCASSDGRPHSHNLGKILQEHLSAVYAFGCSTPQQRLVQLKDLDMDVRPDFSYYPAATVLRRCDCSTGFCNNPDDVCSANVIEEVVLVFTVTNRVDGGSPEYRTVNATQHISCSCQPITNQIK